jgi:uncharacterized membrane protein
MSILAMTLFTIFEVLLVGGVLMIIPRVTRRGLLFGVYVGEDHSCGTEADALRRGYYAGIASTMAIAIVAVMVLVGGFGIPLAGFTTLVVLVGFVITYLKAHAGALRMAGPGGPVAAVAPLAPQPSRRLILPAVALLAGLAGGLFSISYAWAHYDRLPEQFPIHFGITGSPDAWGETSIAAVFLAPFATLLMGGIVGAAALLVANAKMAIRRDDGGVSLRAQERFRTAMTRVLSIVGLIVTAMMVEISITPIQVALGETTGMSVALMLSLVAGLLAVLGAMIYIALRYGQGGAALEVAAAGAPLTDGLADNRHWRFGMLYVNRDDPSIMVESRFGIGYTINLGHWKGITLLAMMIAVPLLLVVIAIVAIR